MCRQTASKYSQTDLKPSESKKSHTWRTREDPFSEEWEKIEDLLKRSSHIQAKTIFEYLNEQSPNRFEPGQLRTLQRQVRRWRALNGSDQEQEIFFSQIHRPGEAAQADFTHTKELSLTLSGSEPYAPLLCHVILPYSGWEWATTAVSESINAIKKGAQEAFGKLGKVPQWFQTDNSTCATHWVKGKRVFNRAYEDFIREMGMKPRTTAVGKKEQNGSVEAKNGSLKRFLEQQLILRNSRDFENEAEFNVWLVGCLKKENTKRQYKVNEELEWMTRLHKPKELFQKDYRLKVTSNATVAFRTHIYSLPPRFIGHIICLRAFEEKVMFFYGDTFIQQAPLSKGQGTSQHHVNYRHMIHSLLRKPGAFSRYRYRDCFFPTLNFKKSYELLQQQTPGIKADVAYLRILHLAATNLEADVDIALSVFLSNKQEITPDAIKELVVIRTATIPEQNLPSVNLKEFDQLLEAV
jgi:transposase InsO family protein